MKIALPTRGNQIDDHFGHCEYYTVFDVQEENPTIRNQETIPSPQGCGCKSDIAKTLADKDVTLMLAGNMGAGALQVLQRAGIEVIRGCKGNIQEVLEAYLNGTLMDSGELCSHEKHHHHHQEHHHHGHHQ